MDTRMKVARCISIAGVALSGSALGLAACSSGQSAGSNANGTYTCSIVDQGDGVSVAVTGQHSNARSYCKQPGWSLMGITGFTSWTPGSAGSGQQVCTLSVAGRNSLGLKVYDPSDTGDGLSVCQSLHQDEGWAVTYP